MRKKIVKIYGEKRTGTNYLTTLILTNFIDTTVFMNVGGWKHGKFIETPNKTNLLNTVDRITKDKINVDETISLFTTKQVKFIIIIKNPYMWIKSMSEADRKPITPAFVKDHINFWNDHYSDYMKYIQNETALLVKYESLLIDPIGTMNSIKTKFNLTTNKDYVFEKRKLLACSDSALGSTMNKICDTSRYTNLDVSKHLKKNIIELINNTIDTNLMQFYDYNENISNRAS